jgi:hypothetical protein
MNELKKRYIIIVVCLLVLTGVWFFVRNQVVEKRTPPSKVSIPAGSVNGEDVSNMIQVYNPFAGAVIVPGVSIVGKARGNWFFEASAPVSIVNEKNEVLVTFPMTAQGEWMTTNLVPFLATVPQFDTKGAQSGSIIFRNDNPGGEEEGRNYAFSLPVRFVQNTETGVLVYMGNTKIDPQMLDCEKVFALGRSIPKTLEMGKSALLELLKGPYVFEKTGGFMSNVENSSLNSLVIKDGEAKVDFSGLSGGGSCKVGQIKAQIEQTLKQFTAVKNVSITVDGEGNILEP